MFYFLCVIVWLFLLHSSIRYAIIGFNRILGQHFFHFKFNIFCYIQCTPIQNAYHFQLTLTSILFKRRHMPSIYNLHLHFENMVNKNCINVNQIKSTHILLFFQFTWNHFIFEEVNKNFYVQIKVKYIS